MGKSKPKSWEAKLQRRHEFCERFVREHHPGMADASRTKDARPLKSLDGPRYLRDGSGNMATDWWLQTDNSMGALGCVWLAHLFDRHKLLDHAWRIGRQDQEPWALISEPYVPPAVPSAVAALRRDLEKVGAELLEYPSEQSTHAPGVNIAVLVANVTGIHTLMGAVARLIAADCPSAEELE